MSSSSLNQFNRAASLSVISSWHPIVPIKKSAEWSACWDLDGQLLLLGPQVSSVCYLVWCIWLGVKTLVQYPNGTLK
jgi:hypothetical protein